MKGMHRQHKVEGAEQGMKKAKKAKQKRKYVPMISGGGISKDPSERYVYLDLLRIFAAFWVIYNHTGAYGWLHWMGVEGPERYISLALSSFCKVAVPLFLMVSGAVLLGKEESLKTLYKKRVSRIVALMPLVAICVYLYWGPKWGYELSLVDFIRKFYADTNVCSYYLWLYLGFLMTLPVLRLVAKNWQLMWYSFALYAVLAYVTPVLEYYGEMGLFVLNQYTSFFTFGYVFPLVGYALHTLDEHYMSWKALLPLGGVSVAMQLFNMYFKSDYAHQTGIENVRLDYLSIFTAIFIFYAARLWCERHPLSQKAISVIRALSATAFGTFLVSVYWIEPVTLAYGAPLTSGLPPLIACLLMCVATMVLSQIVTALLRLIPPIKKIL